MTTATAPARLTDRQAEVLAAIVARIAERGYPPTVRELMAAFGFNGPNGAACHLKPLVKKGYLAPIDWHARGLTVLRLPDGRRVTGWSPVVDENP